MKRSLSELLPHKYPMLFIDKIIRSDAEELVARVNIKEGLLGLENGAVPSWFGVEYMAQAIAAYNALNLVEVGPSEIGFLAGVRAFNVEVDCFLLGSELDIYVKPNLIDESSGSFHCEIQINQKSICRALITTFKPSLEILKKMKEESHG